VNDWAVLQDGRVLGPCCKQVATQLSPWAVIEQIPGQLTIDGQENPDA
jgi:hypothetical protein